MTTESRRWGKPVVINKCAYEGDIDQGWGNITGEELVRRFWEGALRGGYGPVHADLHARAPPVTPGRRLDGSATSASLLARLPLTLTFRDMGGQKKLADLEKHSASAARRPAATRDLGRLATTAPLRFRCEVEAARTLLAAAGGPE